MASYLSRLGLIFDHLFYINFARFEKHISFSVFLFLWVIVTFENIYSVDVHVYVKQENNANYYYFY